MSFNNPFRRVELFATMGGDDGTYGSYGATVNVSNALPNSQGKPLDWWVRGDTIGNISNGFRKAGSPNLFSVAVLNPTDGAPADAGHITSWGDTTITGTDGPSGSFSTLNAHVLDGPAGMGRGYRIQVNANQWPDWMLLKVWSFCLLQRRCRFKASLSNPAADYDEVWIDYYTPGPDPIQAATPAEYNDWALAAPLGHATRLFTTEVKFAADAPSQTLTYDILPTYEYYESLYAVAVYRAKFNAFPLRGAQRANLGCGVGGPLGST